MTALRCEQANRPARGCEIRSSERATAMAYFADILAEVAARNSDHINNVVRVNTAGWNAWYASENRPGSGEPDRPGAAYVDAQFEAEFDEAPEPARPHDPRPHDPRPNEPEQPVNLAAELAAPRLRDLSLRELRALRRQLARRVHPDVRRAATYGGDAMARVNVAIDAAIRARRPQA